MDKFQHLIFVLRACGHILTFCAENNSKSDKTAVQIMTMKSKLPPGDFSLDMFM